jgi:hypothetical protein
VYIVAVVGWGIFFLSLSLTALKKAHSFNTHTHKHTGGQTTAVANGQQISSQKKILSPPPPKALPLLIGSRSGMRPSSLTLAWPWLVEIYTHIHIHTHIYLLLKTRKKEEKKKWKSKHIDVHTKRRKKTKCV